MPTLTTSRAARRPAPPRRGAAVAEFAVVLPVLLLFVMGIVEIGRLVMVAQVATNASRESARYAVQGAADSATVRTYTEEYLAQAGIPPSAVSDFTIEHQQTTT